MAAKFNPEPVLGGFMIGTLIACFLSGATSQQALSYFRQFRKTDRTIYVILVSSLLAIDLFHTFLACYTVYYWQVKNYANPLILIKSPWSFSIEPSIVGLVAFVVQSFYGKKIALRIWILSKRLSYIPILVLFLAFVQLGWGLAATIQIYANNSLFSRFSTFNFGVTTWLVCAGLSDLIITISLVYYLKNAKTAFGNANLILNSIIHRAIETGSLSCICAIINAILFVAPANTSWYIIPQLALVKLYFNSLLVSLNSRTSIVKKLAKRNNGPTFSVAAAETLFPHRISVAAAMTVKVTTKTEVEVELDEERDIFDKYQSKSLEDGRDMTRSITAPAPRAAGEVNWQ